MITIGAIFRVSGMHHVAVDVMTVWIVVAHACMLTLRLRMRTGLLVLVL